MKDFLDSDGVFIDMALSPKNILSRKEAASILGVSLSTVAVWVKEGKLKKVFAPAFSVYFSRDEVMRLKKARSICKVTPEIPAGPRIKELRDQGMKLADIAATLTAEGYRTPKGYEFGCGQVCTALQRMAGQQ